MIIFGLGPFSKDELTIILDDEGAKLLLSSISAIADSISKIEMISCVRRSGISLEDDSKIVLRLEDSDRMEINKTQLFLGVGCDALECAKHQLIDFLEKGYFFPAEFRSLPRSGRKYDTQIFFEKYSSN